MLIFVFRSCYYSLFYGTVQVVYTIYVQLYDRERAPLMEPALQKTKKLFFIKPEIAIVNLRPWQPANAMHTQEATKGVGM